MDSLLMFFREDVLEMWSIDSNGRLLPVNYNSSNKIPLYFLLSGDQILMDSFAKEAYSKNVENSFGEFWKNNSSNMLEYERFGSIYKFDTLLPFTLKESILPSVVKSHFHCGNLSEFLTQFNTLIAFDSFIEQEQQEKINKYLLEIVGYNPNALILIDFWENYKEVLITKNIITGNDSFLFVNGSLGNIYLHLIGKNSPSHLSKRILTGKGHDPRVDTILDFLSEIARAKGSLVSQSDIKKEIVLDAEVILNKLSDGYVIHTIKNDKIGINPLKIGFHRSEIDGRLNNKQSLNYIQNEFDSFRRNNNAENLEIVLSGRVINQSVFKDFFSSTYSKVHSESESFYSEFILRCFEQNKIHKKVVPIDRVFKTPPVVETPPVVNTLPKAPLPSVTQKPPVVVVPPPVKEASVHNDIDKSTLSDLDLKELRARCHLSALKLIDKIEKLLKEKDIRQPQKGDLIKILNNIQNKHYEKIDSDKVEALTSLLLAPSDTLYKGNFKESERVFLKDLRAFQNAQKVIQSSEPKGKNVKVTASVPNSIPAPEILSDSATKKSPSPAGKKLVPPLPIRSSKKPVPPPPPPSPASKKPVLPPSAESSKRPVPPPPPPPSKKSVPPPPPPPPPSKKSVPPPPPARKVSQNSPVSDSKTSANKRIEAQFTQLWNSYLGFILKIFNAAKVKHFDKVEIERGINHVANRDYQSLDLKKMVSIIAQYTESLSVAEIKELKGIEVNLIQAYNQMYK